MQHPTHFQPYSTPLPAVKCLCPVLCAKNIFLGSQQVCSQMGEGCSLRAKGSEGVFRVRVGCSTRPDRRGRPDTPGDRGAGMGCMSPQRNTHQGSSARAESLGLPEYMLLGRGAWQGGMHIQTQKGGKQAAGPSSSPGKRSL